MLLILFIRLMQKRSIFRPKRSESAWSTGSGSGASDILNQLKSAVVSGLKQKLVQVAKGSAGAATGASAGFSKGSSGSETKSYHPHIYEPPHDVSFAFVSIFSRNFKN